MRSLASAVAVLFLSAGAALADEPISTAPPSGPAAPPSVDAAPAAGLGAIAPEPRPVAMGLCGPQAVKADGTLETRPHGVVEAGVGTGGYRHLAAAVCQPIGQNAAVAVSISDTRGGNIHRGRRGARLMGGASD